MTSLWQTAENSHLTGPEGAPGQSLLQRGSDAAGRQLPGHHGSTPFSEGPNGEKRKN